MLAPYEHGDERIVVAGPDVECGSSMSTSMALLMHEFATNSVKYGALSGPDGQVAVTWDLLPDAVELTWTENVSKGNSEQPRAGFGSFLVEDPQHGRRNISNVDRSRPLDNDESTARAHVRVIVSRPAPLESQLERGTTCNGYRELKASIQ